MILALDISTSCTGWSIFTLDGKIVDTGYVDLDNTKLKGKLMKKLDVASEQINALFYKHDIQHVYAEAALSKFTKGKSSAQTINSLIAFNFGLTYQIYKHTGIEPKYIQVISARKICGLKFPKKCDSKIKKKMIFERNKKKYNYLNWKINKIGNVHKSCYDISDSIIIGEAACNQLQNDK